MAMVAAAMADEGRVAAVAARGTVTPWSAHSGALKHFRGNVLTAGEWVTVPCVFASLQQFGSCHQHSVFGWPW